VRHEPALDGLRGLAVAAVVAFHAGAPWMVGGYLGVSTFFTLSGFLITSLLLASSRSDRGLADFWARRARRLLPAAVVCVVGVAALAPVLASDAQLRSLRWDALASLLGVANWRFVVDDVSYADLFSAPSPLLHFWSLAIEQQLYVVVPLVVALVSRRALPWVLGAGVAGSVVASAVTSEATAYFSTLARAGELLVGALLAVVGVRRVPSWAGIGALVVLGALWATVAQGSDWLYAGGFVAHAALSAVVVVAATADGGVVRALLSWPPLRALGRVSYGVYLFHWPVFVWLDQPVVVEVAVALAIAVASYVLVEEPVRRRRVSIPAVAAPAALAVAAGVVVAATLSPPADPFAPPVAAAEDGPRSALAPGAPRVAVFGDSTALRTGYGLLGHGWTTGSIDVRDGGTHVGCPIARGGLIDYVAAVDEADAVCDEWPDRWAAIVERERLDVAVVQAGPWDVTERQLPGTEDWTRIGDPAFDALLRREVSLAVDVLSSAGAVVLWLTTPHVDYPGDHPIDDPVRVDRLNALLRSIDAEREEMVLADVAPRIEAMGPEARPDGVHLTDDAAAELAPWLAEQIVAAAARRN